MSVDSIVAFWIQASVSIDTTYAAAAVKYADHIAMDVVDGVPEPIYRVEFECAINTRNTMHAAIAKDLLSDVDKTVRATKPYEQYFDGLITGVECCNALSTPLHW